MNEVTKGFSRMRCIVCDVKQLPNVSNTCDHCYKEMCKQYNVDNPHSLWANLKLTLEVKKEDVFKVGDTVFETNKRNETYKYEILRVYNCTNHFGKKEVSYLVEKSSEVGGSVSYDMDQYALYRLKFD